ncbi:hypothetical protein KR026_006631, partial [Drosophila bipectinata]
MRVLAAILGLSFSGSRRWNSSLRQLFLLLSIFGIFFNRFFTGNLNAYFIKRPRYAAITNFDELRKSGLPVMLDKHITAFVMENIDNKFFGNTVINLITTSYSSRGRFILSLNDSFAYIINRDMWKFLKKYQNRINRKTFCKYENLQLVSSRTKMQLLQKNSVFKKPLTRYVQYLFESGIIEYWTSYPVKYVNSLNISLPSEEKKYPFPLSFKDLQFLWIFLIMGYGLAFLVFYIEVFCILW